MNSPRRLFAAELPVAGGVLELPVESAHHARVLRLAAGDRVQLFDGRLGLSDAVIEALARDRVVCRAAARAQLPAPAPALHVVLGLPKGGKLENALRMLTELGVAALHIALCERSVPRPGDGGSARMARLSRVAIEACAQSGQPLAPTVHAPAPLLAIAAAIPEPARRLVFWECGGSPLDAALAATDQPGSDVWAVVGPEGGLSEGEVTALTAQGFAAVGLGPAVLRVDTAAAVVAALLLDRTGRLRD
jgi:16S rRNA (uracil1498-N3)-methyltransferase